MQVFFPLEWTHLLDIPFLIESGKKSEWKSIFQISKLDRKMECSVVDWKIRIQAKDSNKVLIGSATELIFKWYENGNDI